VTPRSRRYGDVVRAGKKRRRSCCKDFLESNEKLQQKQLFLPVTREGGC